MEGNMWIFATLGLLLCWMMPVDSMEVPIEAEVAKEEITLTMVEDSVDDMYLGCNKQMRKVKDKFLPEERILKNSFGDRWTAVESRAEDKFVPSEDDDLTIDHKRAIRVYTGDGVYREFNNAVQREGRSDPPSFKYHSLHYLLTSAIQILNNNSPCYSTFRRTRDLFDGKVNTIIRFGFFTSTSISSKLVDFGQMTCFKIKTCLGAYVKKYSDYPTEEEVLIPPYETFKITEINRKKNRKKNIPDLNDCGIVFDLESAGVKSSLNCNAVDKLVATESTLGGTNN